MTDADPLWPTPWVRAAMGTALLAVLAEEPLHGYAIAERLAERGLGRPKGGSLYPLLNSLEQQGAIAASWSRATAAPGGAPTASPTSDESACPGSATTGTAWSQRSSPLLPQLTLRRTHDDRAERFPGRRRQGGHRPRC